MDSCLVSIAVLSYNSEKTIIQTLDSIKNQSYKNIDLLINDDASKDNSVEVIRTWLEENEKSFHAVKLFTHQENQGINKSFDYIVKKCTTKWVKPIAGDDILFENCIELNMQYVCDNSVETIVYSSLIPFSYNDGEMKLLKKDYYENWYSRKLDKMTAKKQYKKLLKRDINFSPTVFLNVESYCKKGGIDLEIKNIEDWPLRLMYVSSGDKIHYYDVDTVYYRIGSSISRTSKKLYNERHLQQTIFAKKRIIYPNISKIHIVYYMTEYLERFRYFVIIKVFKNKDNLFVKMVNLIMKLFELGKWPERIHKFIMKVFKVGKKYEIQNN